MSKKIKATLIWSSSILAIIIITLVGALFIPRVGKKVVQTWSASDKFDIANVATVQKKEGEELQIMLMTDLQLWMNLSDNAKVFKLMDKLVAEEKPDLIILMGDNVSGITTDTLLKSLIKKMESYKIPWAPIFGNHDVGEGSATIEWQSDRFDEAEHCLYERGPSNLYGMGNYAINIVEGKNVVQTLYFFDNGRYTQYEEGKKEIYLGYEQIAWYEWMASGINAASGKLVPSMSFSHFAMPEFAEAVASICPRGEDGKMIFPFTVPEDKGFGVFKYLPGVAPVNSGFIDKAKPLGLKYVFSGHDHENSGSINFEGIKYTYGLKTGMSPRYWNDAEQYGATMIGVNGANDVRVFNKVA